MDFFNKFVIKTFIYIDNQVEAEQVKVGCVEMRRKVEKCILDAVFCSSVGPNIYFSQDKKWNTWNAQQFNLSIAINDP